MAAKKETITAGKARRVGIWLDLDWGLKREIETYAGCQRYALEAGWQLVLDPALKRADLPKPGGLAYDGILARVHPLMADATRRMRVPLVNLWLNSPAQDVVTLAPDHKAAGVMAAEHLLGRGFRRFAFLGAKRRKESKLQFDGFNAKVKQAGFACSAYGFPPALLDGDALRWEEFLDGMQRWITSWQLPMGVLVSNDLHARLLINECIERGLAVPGDVAVVGSENDEGICVGPTPSLTSIDFGHERRGYQAAALLDRMMSGETVASAIEWVAPVRLIPRQSSDIFASHDPLVALALTFIAGQSHRALVVKEVAAVVGASRRTLERRFRLETGHSIAEEMMRLRLNRAKRRLVDKDVLLKTVAQEAGFRSASYFSRVFTQVIGVAPSTFREERQIR